MTQGLHVLTGICTIPLLLVQLWSVYPKLFVLPPAKSVAKTLERLSIAVLASSALVQLTTGFFNVLDWYPWPRDFVAVHRFLAHVVVGSILLHVGVKLPDIKYGLRTELRMGDVLTEVPWEQNPEAYSNNDNTHVEPPTPNDVSRRGVLIAAGTGVGVVAITVAGQTVTPLEPIGALAIRQARKGPAGVPVNRTALQARVTPLASAPDWHLAVVGPESSYTLDLQDIVTQAVHQASFPITCVEGWSVGAHWRGLRLLDVIGRAGGDSGSRVRVTSLEAGGSYRVSYVDGPKVTHALSATHLDGERIDLDHGHPIRLIAPDRAGVLNTKWLTRVEVI